jgi:hypothetical protein
VTIGTLPDDALIEIFSIYVEGAYQTYDGEFRIKKLEVWYTLVHVCQRWRNLAFASPRRLNLRLVCTSTTPVKKMLDVWPTLPIVLHDWILDSNAQLSIKNADNVIAALGHRDRLRQICLGFDSIPIFYACTAMMQESFPALSHLYLLSRIGPAHVLPDSFLGGFTPRLRTLVLSGIPFPALPKLLLSSSYLVDIRLWNVPHSGYISPEAMVTCLSSLTGLEMFSLAFRSPQSHSGQSSRHLSSLTRVDLPALTHFRLEGVNEYIEDFVARINTPLLHDITISFFNRLLFDTSQLNGFIGRVKIFNTLYQAEVHFQGERAYITLSSSESTVGHPNIVIYISCMQSEWQLSSLTEICATSSSRWALRLFSLERLYMSVEYAPPGHWHDDMENTQWQELLQSFAAVKDLYLSEELGLRVAQALRDLVGEKETELLPALQNIFVQGRQLSVAVQETIKPFIDTRQVSGALVAVHHWKRWYWEID